MSTPQSVGRAKLMRKGSPAEKKGDASLEKALARSLKQFTKVIKRIDTDKIEVGSIDSLYKISVAFSSLVRAAQSWREWTALRDGMYEEAIAGVRGELKALLLHEPELLEKFLELTDRLPQQRLIE